MKHPKFSELIHNCSIEQLSEGTAASGDLTETWATFAASVYCQIEPLSGKDRYWAAQVQPEATHRITMRYVSGLTAAMRVIFGSRIFHLDGPPRNLEERSEWHVCLAKEEV